MPIIDSSAGQLTNRVAACGVGLVLSIMLSGCALWTSPASLPPPVASKAPAASAEVASLTSEAGIALEVARQRIADAKRNRTLWKSAVDKLASAEVAAVKRDSPRTLQLSNEIVALCERSTAQALQPPVVW